MPVAEVDIGAPVHAPPSQPANAAPSTATALPQMLTGTLTGTDTWLPPRIDSLPETRGPAPSETRPAVCTEARPSHRAWPFTALPRPLTGSLPRAPTRLPPRIDPLPD